MQVCGKTFSNASALTKHKLTHSDERKHACSMCGKAFKRQDHLNGHMLTHRNKKPFECSVKGCGKSYCDARSLRRHVESRHGHANLPITSSRPTTAHSTRTSGSTSPSKLGIHGMESKSEHRVTKSKKKNKALGTIGGALPHQPNEVISTETESYADDNKLPIEISTESPKANTPFQSNLQNNSYAESQLGSKYVMVKLKDKLMMGTPSIGGEGSETLLLQNSNNNNVLMTPETIATILSNAIVQETTKLTNDLLKVSIPPTSGNQSQLHQLLTQRIAPSAGSIASSNPNSSPGASSTKLHSMGSENSIYPAKWAPNGSEVSFLTCF